MTKDKKQTLLLQTGAVIFVVGMLFLCILVPKEMRTLIIACVTFMVSLTVLIYSRRTYLFTKKALKEAEELRRRQKEMSDNMKRSIRVVDFEDQVQRPIDVGPEMHAHFECGDKD